MALHILEGCQQVSVAAEQLVHTFTIRVAYRKQTKRLGICKSHYYDTCALIKAQSNAPSYPKIRGHSWLINSRLMRKLRQRPFPKMANSKSDPIYRRIGGSTAILWLRMTSRLKVTRLLMSGSELVLNIYGGRLKLAAYVPKHIRQRAQ